MIEKEDTGVEKNLQQQKEIKKDEEGENPLLEKIVGILVVGFVICLLMAVFAKQ